MLKTLSTSEKRGKISNNGKAYTIEGVNAVNSSLEIFSSKEKKKIA